MRAAGAQYGWRGILAEGLGGMPGMFFGPISSAMGRGLSLKVFQSTSSLGLPCTRSFPIIPIATPTVAIGTRRRGCGRI